MNIWTPIIGDDNLLCKQERDNKHDENAIAVLKCNGSGPRIVGYVPLCYSSLFIKFVSLPYHCIKVCVKEKELIAEQDMAWKSQQNIRLLETKKSLND